MAKVLYIMRSKAHFNYHETTIDSLIALGQDVRLVFDDYWSNYGNPSHTCFNEWKKKNLDIEVSYSKTRTDKWRKLVFFTRELRSYSNYCQRGDKYQFYRKRWANYLGIGPKGRTFLEKPIVRKIIGSKIVYKILGRIERFVPADSGVVKWLRKQGAHVVVVSPVNMRFSEEVEIIKAAKDINLPTVIPVLSWDNLSTKGIMHIQPTRLLAWHKGHKEEALKYHGLQEKYIRITGSPFFDKWFEDEGVITDRKEFCDRVGVDFTKQYILYLGSSANIAKDETWFVRKLKSALEHSDDPELRDVQVMFRSHPANWKNGLALQSDGIVVWPKEGTLPDSYDTFMDFKNSLEHAKCVVGINTSGMLDAVIYNKPVITPLIEEYRLTQQNTQHFRRMQDNEAVYVSNNVDGVVEYIKQILNGDDPLCDKRVEFIKTYIRPRGLERSAGSVVAEEILEPLPTELRQPMNKKSPLGHLSLIEVEIKNIFKSYWDNVEQQRSSDLYKFYLDVRDKIMYMIQNSNYKLSSYWAEEVIGFDYMFDATPIIVAKIREHCYHITGERSYNYRLHHQHKAKPFLQRLEQLSALDNNDLFVPESEKMGGFGYKSSRGLINVDTLKFYEVLIGLDKAGFLDEFRLVNGSRKSVLEIGSGWGGFAYQFKTLFPNITYFLIDLPATMLFAAIYLKGMFTNSKIVLFTGDNVEIFDNWQDYDFILISAYDFEKFKPSQLDMAINMVSFQEMTTEQVSNYVNHVADLKCDRLYSMNRERSPHNPELSLVSEIIEERYKTNLIDVLDTEYTVLGSKVKNIQSKKKISSATYRHLAAKLRKK